MDEEAPITHESVMEELALLWQDQPEELRRFSHRLSLLLRLQKVDAPEIIIGNQKRLVYKAIVPALDYLKEMEQLYRGWETFDA